MRPIDADALIEFCTERWIPLNIDAVNMQPTIQPEKAQLYCEGTTKDAISRQAALDILHGYFDGMLDTDTVCPEDIYGLFECISPAQPEPAIPLTWIEKYIEWHKSLDSEFANLAAAHISVMVKKWRDEQDETDHEKDVIDMPSALNNQVNLCDSCKYTYPECPSEKDDVIFGNGIGNDNICACNKYQPTVQTVATDTNVGDTISRQAAIDALDFEIVHIIAYRDGKNEGNPLAQYNKGLEDGKKAIEALPPAQPEPHEGHWINGKCDLCGEHAPFWAMASTYHESNYCPCCGAKMKGERQK